MIKNNEKMSGNKKIYNEWESSQKGLKGGLEE